MPRWAGLGVALATALLALTLNASPADADTEIGSRGSGAGQTLDPAGIALDYSDELLYVADSGNRRVAVFDAGTGEFVRAFGWGVADGSSEELQVCTATCFKGLEGSGPGQFSTMNGIAVDNDPLSPAYHDVYVVDRANHRVQRFEPAGAFVWMIGGEVNKTTGEDLCVAGSGDVCGVGKQGSTEGSFNPVSYGAGIAVGATGTVYVHDRVGSGATAETRVQKYEPAGAYISQLTMPVPGGSGGATGTAIDSEGNMYLGTAGAQGAVRKYSPAGAELLTLSPSFNITAVTVDPANRLFIADGTAAVSSIDPNVHVRAIIEYSLSGTKLRVFYGEGVRRQLGLVHLPGAEEIFASEQETTASAPARLVTTPFPPAGPVAAPGPEANAASGIGNDGATLHAMVNPENAATTYHFEYISDQDFKAAGEAFGVGTISTPETPLPGAVDFELHEAKAELTELFPETLYHFRVVAANADGGPNPGPTMTFETKEPLEIGDTWATAVGTDRASLHAEVDPLGLPATGRFEYVDEATFGESEFDQAQEAPSASADPLDFGEGEGMQERSAQLFSLAPATTYRYRVVAYARCEPEPAPLCEFPGPVRKLRTFDLPEEKATGCHNDPYRTGPAGYLPDCRAYEMVSPVDKGGSNVEATDNISGFPASLDQAAVDGDSISYSTYKAFGAIAAAPYVNQYLSRRSPGGWSTEAISPHREGPSIMTLLSANLDRQYKSFGADLCASWVVQDAKPILAEGGIDGYPGLYRRDNCAPGAGDYETITRVEPPLTDPGIGASKFIPELQGTSESGDVALFMVKANLTSDSPPQPAGCDEGFGTCENRLYEAREGKLEFVCVLPDESLDEGGCVAGRQGTAGERFGALDGAVSDDGSRVVWNDAAGSGPGKLYMRVDGVETIQITATDATFWTASSDGTTVLYSIEDDLYEYDVDSKVEEPIAENAGSVAGGFGVAGASDDASRVYFTSVQDLAAGAVAGEPNLYLYERGSGYRFIATLEAALLAENDVSPYSSQPSGRVSRVTPDGEQIAFMWAGSLTGYDNRDAVSGERDQEVYLYDATADGGAGELRCISCNPTGARPAGRKIGRKRVENVWAAAWLPAWESQLYAQRLLSDDGQRLYFNSFEALVPRDINGKEDVYQWESAGTGSCTTADPTYSESTGGCVTLISTGQDGVGSEIVDISTDGDDVFFKTESSLVAQDRGLVDIYDARVGGGFPEPASPPVECQGEACQHPAPAPDARTPSSSNVGPGNPVYKKKPGRKCGKGKRKVKRKGKVRCVQKKKHRKSKRHNRRQHRGGASR